jgi:hypothetical protein|nr:ATP-binding protein [Streptacidiphilus carbonis]
MAPRGKAEQRVTDGTGGGAVAALEHVIGGGTGVRADPAWLDDWTAALWPETLGGSVGCPEDVTPEELELALFGQLTDPLTEEVRLPSGPASSVRARRLVRSALDTWGLGGLGEVAEQLVGELVANVVRHTGGRSFGLRLVRRQGSVRFEVRDPSRALPCLIMGEPGDEAGRGLQLVDLMSDRWGADLRSHGKSVWFELRTREPGTG